MVSISSMQEEADTLLILYAVAVSRQGNSVHVYSGDTDVLVLALQILSQTVVSSWVLEIDNDSSSSSPSMLL